MYKIFSASWPEEGASSSQSSNVNDASHADSDVDNGVSTLISIVLFGVLGDLERDLDLVLERLFGVTLTFISVIKCFCWMMI